MTKSHPFVKMSFMEKEVPRSHITATEEDCWTCLCGNQPAEDGFYPCDESGNEAEPTPNRWKQSLYVCDTCGRIIHQGTLEVVGWAASQGSSESNLAR